MDSIRSPFRLRPRPSPKAASPRERLDKGSMGEKAFLSSPWPGTPGRRAQFACARLRGGDGGMALAGVRVDSMQVQAGVAEIHTGGPCHPRAGREEEDGALFDVDDADLLGPGPVRGSDDPVLPTRSSQRRSCA